jgi:branched-chain amino acid transport system substrate-binding protein
MNVDDDMIAGAFADFIAQRVRSLSLLAYNDDFGRGAITAYRPRLTARGVRIASIDVFDRGTPDYRPLLSRVKQRNPEGILLVTTASDAMVFVRQFYELGMSQKVFSRGDIGSPEFVRSIKDTPKLAEGWVEATVWAQGIDSIYEQRYAARWNTAPVSHGALAYYAVRYVLAAGIEQAIRDTGQVTREGLRDALHRISIQTPIGRIQFDAHNQAYPYVYVIEIRGGEVKILRSLRVVPPKP